MNFKLYMVFTFVAVSSVLCASASAQKTIKIEKLQAELEQVRQQSQKK